MIVEQKKRNKILITITLVFSVTIFGCDDSVNKLAGIWLIEKASLENRNAIYQEFWGKNITFGVDGKCGVPPTYDSDFNGQSKWKFLKIGSRNCIEISSESPYFNDVFSIDTLTPLKLVLSNKTKFISMSKVY